MSEKNPDVEWLRAAHRGSAYWFAIDNARAFHLITYIDALEAKCRDLREREEEHGRQTAGPNVHEIAADLYTRWVKDEAHLYNYPLFAELSYRAAEALIAERRRRDDKI